MTPDERWLRDILHNIALARGFIADLNEAAFLEGDLHFYAVEAALLKISEAARRLSPDMTESSPDLPWGAIRAIRNIIAHEYQRVDRRIIWRTVNTDLPKLQAFAETALARLPKE